MGLSLCVLSSGKRSSGKTGLTDIHGRTVEGVESFLDRFGKINGVRFGDFPIWRMTSPFVFLTMLFQKNAIFRLNVSHLPDLRPRDVPLRRLIFFAINEKLIGFFTHNLSHLNFFDMIRIICTNPATIPTIRKTR